MNLIERASALTWNFFNIVDNQQTDINSVANNAIDVLTLVAGIVAVIYLIYSGILYLTAAGNPDAAKKGQQGIVNAVIGIIVIVLAYVIVTAITGTVETQFKKPNTTSTTSNIIVI